MATDNNVINEATPLLPPTPPRSADGQRNFDDASTKNVVEFDPHGDVEDPKQWPNAFKYSAVFLLAFMAFTV